MDLIQSAPRRGCGGEGGGGACPGETHPVSKGPALGEDPEARTFLIPEGFSMTTSEPLVQAAMGALAEAWPRSVAFPALLVRAREATGAEASSELVAARLRAVLLQAYLARIVMLSGCPPPVIGEVGERPTVSPLARAQSAAGLKALSSLLHANVRLDGELEASMLNLLDGTRTLAEVAAVLGASPEQIKECVERLASVGLLWAT